jgi:hypothetical protein
MVGLRLHRTLIFAPTKFGRLGLVSSSCIVSEINIDIFCLGHPKIRRRTRTAGAHGHRESAPNSQSPNLPRSCPERPSPQIPHSWLTQTHEKYGQGRNPKERSQPCELSSTTNHWARRLQLQFPGGKSAFKLWYAYELNVSSWRKTKESNSQL